MNNTFTLNPPIWITQGLTLKLKFSLKAFWIITLILIGTLLIFYIFQINEMTKGIYLLKIYERKIADLSKENKTLEITSSQLNSLENLEGLVKNLNFEKIDKIHYIRVLESQVVTK